MGSSGKNLEKLNISTSLLNQAVAVACGILIPRMLLGAFGSEAYGISVSITQFLSYISLLEGGIGGVARAELYTPLAEKDKDRVSGVYHAEKRFFYHISIIFVLYSLALGLFYPDIAHVTLFSRAYVFGLVMVIGLSTLAQYMGGLTNLTLIVADQHVYINNIILVITTILNTALLALLIYLHCTFLLVKLGSSLVFLVRPVLYGIYVKRHYSIRKRTKEKVELKQKWTGLGQHIAYFLHTNTDVMVLTFFADPQTVAVYAVYNMVVSSIRAFTESFAGGMEALFGKLLAEGNKQQLVYEFKKYSLLLACASFVLFGCTGILILSFVRLYTSGITDADYFRPQFAIILVLAEAANCIAFPSASLPVAANELKETRWGAYGEAAINIGLSCLLVQVNPLAGVALGTLAATVFRGIYYIRYSTEKILSLSTLKTLLSAGSVLGLLYLVVRGGQRLLQNASIHNFFQWAVYGLAAFFVIGLMGYLFYRAVMGAMKKGRQA